MYKHAIFLISLLLNLTLRPPFLWMVENLILPVQSTFSHSWLTPDFPVSSGYLLSQFGVSLPRCYVVWRHWGGFTQPTVAFLRHSLWREPDSLSFAWEVPAPLCWLPGHLVPPPWRSPCFLHIQLSRPPGSTGMFRPSGYLFKAQGTSSYTFSYPSLCVPIGSSGDCPRILVQISQVDISTPCRLRTLSWGSFLLAFQAKDGRQVSLLGLVLRVYCPCVLVPTGKGTKSKGFLLRPQPVALETHLPSSWADFYLLLNKKIAFLISSNVLPKPVVLWYKCCALCPPGFALCSRSQALGIKETNTIKTSPNVLVSNCCCNKSPQN